MSVNALKEQARRLELKEDWTSALGLYLQALEQERDSDQPDISLYNRVADLQLRLGDVESAVDHYERAVDLYIDADLANNAIAVCKKVIRNHPRRASIYRKMGRIRAAQGFPAEARQHFLTFAELKRGQGDIEETFNALIEFVELVPEDIQMRLDLATQLETHQREGEAVEQLTEAYRLLISNDREEEAIDVRNRLLKLDPTVALPDADTIRAEATTTAKTSDFQGAILPGLEYAYTSFGDEDEDEEPAVVGAETETKEVDASDSGDVEDEVPAEPKDANDLKALLDLKVDLDSLTSGGEEVEGEPESLPVMESDGDKEEVEAEPLPMMEFDGGEEVVAEVEEAREEALEESAFEEVAGEQEVAAVAGEAAVEFSSHEAAAESGDFDAALELIHSDVSHDPNNIELRQRMVEYAFRKNDDEVLTEAYLELADCLVRTGSPSKAHAVYQQVLSTHPNNERARSALRELEGRPTGPARAQVTTSEEYVDLGALILDDEDEDATRWVVPADTPSGDDETDLAHMLAQFKHKVSEHMAEDDVSAHHDLGTAYMEMGLLDEAVAEFQQALRAAAGHLPTYENLGRCFIEKGDYQVAVRSLERALEVPCEIEDELIGIYYHLGRAHEGLGNTEQAVEFYEKVFSLDINFEDVTERLRALR